MLSFLINKEKCNNTTVLENFPRSGKCLQDVYGMRRRKSRKKEQLYTVGLPFEKTAEGQDALGALLPSRGVSVCVYIQVLYRKKNC